MPKDYTAILESYEARFANLERLILKADWDLKIKILEEMAELWQAIGWYRKVLQGLKS